MDQRRLLLFITISMLIWFGWINFLVPLILPEPPKKVPAAASTDEKVAAEQDDAEKESKSEAAKIEALKLPDHPARSLWVGPQQDEKDEQALKEFCLAAKFRSEGASIETIELTDVQHYPAFGHRGQRLKIIGAGYDPRFLRADGESKASTRRTFGMQIPVIDKLLKDLPADQIAWEVAEETADSVTFKLRSPDGVWEVTKQFKLRRLSESELQDRDIRANLADGYKVTLKVTLKNLSDKSQPISYTLQGPTGVPLEDADNTYKYRDVRMAFLRDDGKSFDESKMAASEVVSKEKAQTPVIWKRPIKYIGIDVAYFAALVQPADNQKKSPTLDSTSPKISYAQFRDKAGELVPNYTDISVDLISKEFAVPAKDSIEHEYFLYTLPKRQQLLHQVSADAVLDYGWFDSICRGMVMILNLFHSLGLSYGLAIICLTVVVRTLLIPLSKHQAAHAAKMKELQPRIQARQKELEARHGKNTEEYIKASQELVAEQSKMMLGGCLPMLLQLPIFIALYRSLSSSIELRMEPFLWFENLASPDALFPLGFKVWWLGWTEFNLLPCISIGLMMIHQKLTMPPAQNEEQAAQYKMMNIMMFVMGATFYRVPAGLCLYFIATNIWSMTERSYFEKKAKQLALNPPPAPPPPTSTSGPQDPPKQSTLMKLWQQAQAAADKNVSIRNERDDSDSGGKNGGDSKGKNGKKRGKR